MESMTLDKPSNRKRGLNRHKVVFAWGWLIPMLIYYTIFSIVPVAMVIVFGFTDWNGLNFSEIKWIGFQNYINFFSDSEYLKIFGNTLIMGGLIMFFSIIVSFFVALLMNCNIHGKTIYRTIWYIPVVVSMAVVSELVFNMLDTSTGVINVILRNWGFEPVMWSLSPAWLFFWIILVSIWKGLGGTIILFLAGMTSIPTEMYEAASIDGANKRQKLWYITLPGLRQMSAFILITASMGIFSIFEQVQLIARDQPDVMVIMYQIYNEAFVNFNVGMGSALSVIVLILVCLVTILNMKVTKLNI